MKIYLVGGAVRDQLLGFPVKERDWVVVGTTPQEMLGLGYRPVGKDFPVFLHPTTHEEYALARTERKTAPGYKGFHFYAAPDVTLVQDLQRRDLTINAMAQEAIIDSSGKIIDICEAIIDPFNGQEDLKNHLFHHVSNAFAEDPVRILRVARFSARFSDFALHPDTLQLMQEMVRNGEVNALVPERVWQEWEKALQESHPEKFFDILCICGALSVLFPEFSKNKEGFKALERAAQRHAEAIVCFAVLFHTLDTNSIRAITKRYHLPKDYHALALLVANEYQNYDKVSSKIPEEQLCMLERLDALRRPERLNLFLSACEIIADNSADSQNSQILRHAVVAAKSVNVQDLVLQNTPGETIKKELRKRQIVAIIGIYA